jgi:arylsulfatase A-like enzyme
MKKTTVSLALAGALSSPLWSQTPGLPETFKGKIGTSFKESTPDWASLVAPTAPKGAPNVVLILLDDVGFGATSTFGGPAQTPVLDSLANVGARYNRFHTCALSSPTRAALLTGRNHHQVGFGNLADIPSGYPGYSTLWRKDAASVAEVLRRSGYATGAFGKWHNTPSWQTSSTGPFDRWPTGLGFDRFYGFLFGETSQYEPQLYLNTNPVEPPKTAAQGYHLTTDLVDHALRWVDEKDAENPDQPFFLYLATGAVHAPLHVPKEWADRYKGKFDQGWDKLREETYQRQLKAGIIPEGTKLTPRPEGLSAWESIPQADRPVLTRQAEIFAGFASQTDAEIGRLFAGLRAAGKAENTLVIYVVGDNGGSAEGGLEGSDENFALFRGLKQTAAQQLPHVNDLGGPAYDNHFAVAWAWATNSPLQWTKQIASHLGGVRNGLVVSWPGHIQGSPTVRSQFSHVNDIAPTIYAATGVKLPDTLDGVKQQPLAGTSLLPTFADPKAPETHTVQYFEMFGNRGIYKDGWWAGARHYAPWTLASDIGSIWKNDPNKDRWELYDLKNDFSQSQDLASTNPDKLTELQKAFDVEARKYSVYPILPIPLGAPNRVGGRDHFVYRTDLDRFAPGHFPELAGRSHKITAKVSARSASASGVIFAQGGRYGGFALYAKDGHLVFENNSWNQNREAIRSETTLPAGTSTVTWEYTSDSPGLDGLKLSPFAIPLKGGKGRILVDGKEVAKGEIERFTGGASITESFDIGKDLGGPAVRGYEGPNPFEGKVERVDVDVDNSSKTLGAALLKLRGDK